MSKGFQRGRHQRNGSTRTYRQEDSYHTGRRRINMNVEKSEIFINNSLVGKVIGKGGSKIRELQDESNAYIKVLKTDFWPFETPIMLSGTPEAIEKATRLIEELVYGVSYLPVQNNGTSKVPNNYTQPSENESFSWAELPKKSEEARLMNMDGEKSSEIFVDSSFVGKVIGKGGSKIRELQDESNAYIRVLKNDLGSVETPIMLSGTPEAIEKAKSLIEDLVYGVSNLPVQSNWTYKTPVNYTQLCETESFDWTGAWMNRLEKSEEARLIDMESEKSSEIFVDSSFVGKIIGRGGYKRRELQNESNAYIKVLKNDIGAASTSIMLTGTSEAVEKAKRLIGDLISDASNIFEGDSYRTNRWKNMDNEKSSDIDNSFAGKVNGKEVFKIKELQDINKANIKVLKKCSSTAETPVKSIGTSEAIGNSKSLMKDIIYDARNLSVQNNQIKSFNNYTYASEDKPFDWAELQEKDEEARLKKLTSLPTIIKNFYQEDPEVSFMRSEDVKKIRKENNCISVMKIDSYDDRKVPNPVTSFKQAFHNFPELLEELRRQGFSTPSPIQSQAWPILLQGYDMIGIAQTGTGKTIAFLLPALVHIAGQATSKEERIGPGALILAPTRELAQQIEAEAKNYQYKGIKSISICGGDNRRNQSNVITKGIDIIIATPGRLNDLYMSELIDVSGVTYLVLDEADHMLDMGFEPQIKSIIAAIREDRQTVITSSIWTEAIQQLVIRYMTRPFKVNVEAVGLAEVRSAIQEIIFCEDDCDERRQLLDEFIKTMGPDAKVVVFVETKAFADDIANDLNMRGTAVQSMHNDKEQWDKKHALHDFRSGNVKILVATDVVSRELDFKDITVVFNLFFPYNIEEYVHRVVQTGKYGRVISVVTRRDWNHSAALIKILQEADQYVPDELYDIASRYKSWKGKNTAQD